MAISQKIIWKYETPLQGEYLARSLFGGITPGLVSPLDVEIDATGAKLSIKSSFQCYIRPDNYYEDENSQGLLVKVDQEISGGDILSYTVLEDNAIALGIRYTWVSDTSQEAVIETLYYDDVTDDLTDYKGVILCCFDTVNKRVYPNMADFTLSYSQTIPALSGVGYRGLLPREFSNATQGNTADRNIQALVRYLQYSEGLVKSAKTVVPVSAVVGTDRISKTFYISIPEYIKVGVCLGASFPVYQILSYTNTYYVNSDDDVPESLSLLYSDLSDSVDKIGLPSDQTALVALKRSATIFNSQDDSVVDVSGSGVGSSDGASTFDNQIITERILVSDVDSSGNVASDSTRGLYINKDVLYFSPSEDFSTEKSDQIYQNGSPSTLLNSYMIRALFHCQPFSFNKQLSATNTGTTEVFSNAFYFGFPDFSIAFGDDVPYSVSVDGFEGSFSVGRKLPAYGKDCFCFWYGYNLSPSVYGEDKEIFPDVFPDTWVQRNGVWYEPVKTIDDFSVDTTQDIEITEYNGNGNIAGMWNRPNDALMVVTKPLPSEDTAHKLIISNIGSAGEDTTNWLMEMTLTYSQDGDNYRGMIFFDKDNGKLDRGWYLMRNTFAGRVGNGMAFRVGANNDDESSRYTVVANEEVKIGFLFNGAVQGGTADFFFDGELKEVPIDNASILTTKSPAIIDGSVTLRFAEEADSDDTGNILIKKIVFYKPYKPVVEEGSTVSTRCCGSGSNRFYPPTNKSFVPEISRLRGSDVFKGSSYTLRDYKGNTRAIYYQSKALSQVQANGMIIDKNSLVPERYPDWYFGVFDLPVYPPDITDIASWDTEKNKPKYRFINGALSACEVIAQATIDPTQRFMRFLKSSPFTSYSAPAGLSRGLQESISCIDIVHFGHSYCYGFVENILASISKVLTLEFSAQSPDTVIYTIGDLEGRSPDKVLDYNYYIECSGTGTGYLNIKTADKTNTFKPLIFIKNQCDSTISVRYGNNSFGVDIPVSESMYLVSLVSAKGDLMSPRVYASPVFSYFAEASAQVSGESVSYSYATSFDKGLYLGMSFNQRMPMIYSKMEYEGEGSKEFDWTKPAMFQYVPEVTEGDDSYWAVFVYQEMWVDKRQTTGSVPCFSKRVYSGTTATRPEPTFHFGSIIDKYKNLVSNVPKGLSSDPDVSYKAGVYSMPTFDFPEATGTKCNPYIMHCVVPYGTSFNLDYYGTETGYRCGVALSQATVIPYSDTDDVSGLLYSSLDTSLRETGCTFFGTAGSEDGYFCLVANDADKVVTNLFRSTTFLNIVKEVVVPEVTEAVVESLGDLPDRVTAVETDLAGAFDFQADKTVHKKLSEFTSGIVSTDITATTVTADNLTSEFLYRYKFDHVVDDEDSWQDFCSNRLGGVTSVLIKGNHSADSVNIVASQSIIVVLEGNVVLDIRSINITGDMTNFVMFCGGHINSCGNISSEAGLYFSHVIFSGSFIQTSSDFVIFRDCDFYFSGGVSSGFICENCCFSGNGNIFNTVKLRNCRFSSMATFAISTLTDCTIKKNSKLTDSTLIDCDYTVSAYASNLVYKTTFRNCNIVIDVTTSGSYNTFFYGTCYNCTINIKHNNMVNGVRGDIYDSEFIYSPNNFFINFNIYGKSYANVNLAITHFLKDPFVKSMCGANRINVDLPFYRNPGGNFMSMPISSSIDTIVPGVVHILTTRSVNLLSSVSASDSSYFFTSNSTNVSLGTTIQVAGLDTFIFWQRQTLDGYFKVIL